MKVPVCYSPIKKKIKPFNNIWLDTNQNWKVHLVYKCKGFVQKCNDVDFKDCEIEAQKLQKDQIFGLKCKFAQYIEGKSFSGLEGSKRHQIFLFLIAPYSSSLKLMFCSPGHTTLKRQILLKSSYAFSNHEATCFCFTWIAQALISTATCTVRYIISHTDQPFKISAMSLNNNFLYNQTEEN